MSLHESFDARQARQNARLDAVIAAAIAGPRHTAPPIVATEPRQPVTASPSPVPYRAVAALPAPAAEADHGVITTGPGLIGHGWDAAIDMLNAEIDARGGVLPSHVQASEIAPPMRAITDDPHGWNAVVDRLNDDLPRSSAQQTATAASSWDDVIARMNAERGFTATSMQGR